LLATTSLYAQARYTAARVGSCARKVGYGIIVSTAGDCRRMGGAMNGNPPDGQWTDCHLDWCADGDPGTYVAAKPGSCQTKVGYGIIQTTGRDCRRMGGAMNGVPADNQWTDCHLDWCSATSGAAYVAAPANSCADRTGYGIIKMTAGNCRQIGGGINGNPPNDQWIDCHLDWCPRSQYQLTVIPPANGYIFLDGHRIRCGSGPDQGICSLSVAAPGQYTLWAFPATGYAQSSWGGACSDWFNSQTCSLTLDGPKTVSKQFNRTGTFTITVAPPQNAKIEADWGGTCPPDCSRTGTQGNGMRLTAKPLLGYRLTGWTGACAGQGDECILTFDANKSTAASIAHAGTATITVSPMPPNGMLYVPPALRCGNGQSNCSMVVTKGSSQTITAFPSAGTWGGACAGQLGQMCTLQVNGDVVVSRTFP
jgi:hypothetical protein